MADANIFLRKGFAREGVVDYGHTMTVQGAVNKAGILMVLLLAGAAWTWNLFFSTMDGAVLAPYIYGGAIAGFILALVTIFKPNISSYTAPLYALAEGLFLGGISALFEASVPGVALNAFLLTGGILFVMLALYKLEIIRATPGLVKGIVAATCTIALVYVVDIVMGFFGVSIPMIHESGWIGIIFSLVVIGIAAFNLIIDFNFIERGAAEGLPGHMEWYGAFGLLVTLVWLYLEILRLLMKLSRR